MNTIMIKDLEWYYQDKKILNKININIQYGEFLSIIGPNGSGKTTLLKNISKNLEPSKDCIYINGEELLSINNKTLARTMSSVPQNTFINFEFSALDIVLMGRTPYLKRFQNESDEDIKIAKKAMEYTNTWYLKDKNINQLSGGERQRVIVARAIAQQTNIMLLDEPISNLDIHHQIEILDTIKSLNKDKKITVIAVLHDLNLAAQYSDRLVMLNNGKIVSYGKPEKVLTKENLCNVYNMNFYMTKNPLTSKLYIIPISNIYR